MSDWQVGDLALCVGNGVWFDWSSEGRDPTLCGPQQGEINEVVALEVDEYGDLQLEFAKYPNDDFDSAEFRKILPDKHEACEDEFVILLKLSKQRSKEGANAFGTALSSLRDEACFASSPFGFQSTFALETGAALSNGGGL